MTDFIRTSILAQIKEVRKMEIAKLSALLTGSLNIMLFFGAWFANLDNTKSTLLFFMAMSMTAYRFYRWAIREKATSMHKKNMDTFDRMSREMELREKEIELMERQNRLIRQANINDQNGEIL